jgi:hypothetical protein
MTDQTAQTGPAITATALTDLSFQCADELARHLSKQHRELLRLMNNMVWDAALLDRMPDEAREQAAARLGKARELLDQVKQAPALPAPGLPKAAYRFKRMFEQDEP